MEINDDTQKFVNQNSQISSVLMFLLFITFLVLKLTHVINWSWWWITAPLWGGLAVAIAIGIIFLLIAFIVWLFHG